MDFAATLTLAIAVMGLSMKPGPGMMAIMSRTLNQGMSACFMFMLGVNLVSMFYLGLVLAGLHFAKDDLLFISVLIKSLAAVYLIYIGIKGLQHPDIDLSLKEGKGERYFDTFAAAAMLTLSNPLIILFYAGILPTLIDTSVMSLTDMIIIALVIIFIETGVAVAYCLPLAFSRHFFTPNLMKNINIGASIVIILVGLYIGYSALPAKDIMSLFQ